MFRTLYTILFLLGLLLPHTARAQDELPAISPAMIYTDADGQEVESAEYSGSAPLTARFEARPEHVGTYTPLYEWRFTRSGESSPFLIRHEENTEYTFTQSGTFTIELEVSFVQGTDTLQYATDAPFSVSIEESKLEVPNAFTPNGDGINDVLRVKEGYRSIVEFRAQVFSRWGKKLYEWTDPAGGWDGKSGGRDVPDGAYYLHIDARGADGLHYRVKKVVNLLRGYTESSGAGG